MKKIWIAVGGSGGHLYPAQTVAKELAAINPSYEIIFIGHGLSSSPFFERKNELFYDIKASYLKKTIKGTFQFIFNNLRGILSSVRLILKHQPDLVVGFGSYHSFPPLIAALVKKTPFVLFECNAQMGKVNHLLKNRARCVYTALFDFDDQRVLFLKVKMPLASSKLEKIEKKLALNYYGLSDKDFTFLIFGGSQGAVTLNEAVAHGMIALKSKAVTFQVIHFTGEADEKKVKALYEQHQIKSCVKAFENQMHYGYSAADFAITRSGASTIAELLEHQLPSLFIPYPFAPCDHQRYNAEFFQNKTTSFKVLLQKELKGEKFLLMIEDAIKNRQKVSQYKESAKVSLAQAIDGFFHE